VFLAVSFDFVLAAHHQGVIHAAKNEKSVMRKISMVFNISEKL
jgi:hypothetical protein